MGGEDEKSKDDKVDFQQKPVKIEECLKTMIDLSYRVPTFHAESSKALLKKRERGEEKSSAQAKEDNNREEKGQKEEEHEEDEMNDEATSTMETDAKAYVRPSYWWGNEETLKLVHSDNIENIRLTLPFLPRLASEIN